MCIGNNRYAEPQLTFDDTILAGLRVRNETSGKIEHVLAYFNKPQVQGAAPAYSTRRGLRTPMSVSRPVSRGNAMLIAVPIKPGSKFNGDNLIAVSSYPRFMQDYKKAVAPRPKTLGGMRRSRGFDSDSLSRGPIVVKGFDGGLYDVIISLKATDIIGVLKAPDKIDANKRPSDVNEPLYRELDIAYAGKVAFVLACFDEADADKAGCFAVRYTPRMASKIFLPGLDGHNGTIERGMVELNHTIVVGSFDMPEGVGTKVEFEDFEDNSGGYWGRRNQLVRPSWMLDRVIGSSTFSGMVAPQGDFVCDVADVKKGKFRCLRALPPGWGNLPGRPSNPAKEPFYLEA